NIGSSHVEYQIGVKAEDGGEWVVSRRYREFQSLQASLRAVAAPPPLPERRFHGAGALFMGPPTEAFLAARQAALQEFLEAALARQHTELGLGEALRQFLGFPPAREEKVPSTLEWLRRPLQRPRSFGPGTDVPLSPVEAPFLAPGLARAAGLLAARRLQAASSSTARALADSWDELMAANVRIVLLCNPVSGSDEAWSFDPNTGSYQRLAAPLKPRISPGLAATKGFCFVVGSTGSSLLQRACTSADNPWARSWGERLVDVSFGERGCWEPLPRGGEGDGTHVAACAGRGCVYAFGGLQTGKPSSQALRLDLRTGLWQPLPRLPTPRFECAAVFVHDLCIVAGGASVAGAATDVVEGFAPSEGKHGRWRSLPSLRQPRFAFAMVAAPGPSGQALYAIGGLCSGITLAVVERLDLSRPTAWEFTEPLGQPRHHCGAATAAGKIFVFGGCNGAD
ncbi:KLHL5, partial [Symbiodinium sp. CCMP2456]